MIVQLDCTNMTEHTSEMELYIILANFECWNWKLLINKMLSSQGKLVQYSPAIVGFFSAKTNILQHIKHIFSAIALFSTIVVVLRGIRCNEYSIFLSQRDMCQNLWTSFLEGCTETMDFDLKNEKLSKQDTHYGTKFAQLKYNCLKISL